jgi:hypothetical protein
MDKMKHMGLAVLAMIIALSVQAGPIADQMGIVGVKYMPLAVEVSKKVNADLGAKAEILRNVVLQASGIVAEVEALISQDLPDVIAAANALAATLKNGSMPWQKRLYNSMENSINIIRPLGRRVIARPSEASLKTAKETNVTLKAAGKKEDAVPAYDEGILLRAASLGVVPEEKQKVYAENAVKLAKQVEGGISFLEGVREKYVLPALPSDPSMDATLLKKRDEAAKVSGVVLQADEGEAALAAALAAMEAEAAMADG